MVYVTTTDDNAFGTAVIPGSFRWALERESGPRNILFQVGGTVVLKRPLVLSGEADSFVTIAGQTAPGDGIQITNYGLQLRDGVHDVVVRFLKMRVANNQASPLREDVQGLSIGTTHELAGNPSQTVRDIIIDHSSLEWVNDDHSLYNNFRRVTLQYNIFGEGSALPWKPALGPGVIHSTGLLVGGAGSRSLYDVLSVHHNLFIHNAFRNPQIGLDGGVVEVVNNLIYNASQYGTQIRADDSGVCSFPLGAQSTPRVNLIGNYYLAGRETNLGRRSVDVLGRCLDDQTIYVRDNLGPGRMSDALDDWQIVGEREALGQTAAARLRRPTAWPVGALAPVQVESATAIAGSLAAKVGAIYPRRDALDQRLISELTAREGDVGFGKTIDTLEPLPVLASGAPVTDTDQDGLPNDWEILHGLNPLTVADGALDRNGDGYSNLEEYLNELVIDSGGGSELPPPGDEGTFVPLPGPGGGTGPIIPVGRLLPGGDDDEFAPPPPPVISVVALDAAAAEPAAAAVPAVAADTATFRISRTGVTYAEWWIYFNLTAGSGYATIGADFADTLISPAIIPEGQSYVDLIVTPLYDGLNEDEEWVKINLLADSDYQINAAATSATAAIADRGERVSPTETPPPDTGERQTSGGSNSRRRAAAAPAGGAASAPVSGVPGLGGSPSGGVGAAAGGSLPRLVTPLFIGMRGEPIRLLQTMLSRYLERSDSGLITGLYDQPTVTAVQAFQRAEGILASGSPETNSFGFAGPTTRARLNAIFAAPTWAGANPAAPFAPSSVPGGAAPTTLPPGFANDPVRVSLLRSLTSQLAALVQQLVVVLTGHPPGAIIP